MATLGCDRIQDTPEPDYFIKFNPEPISFKLEQNNRDFLFNLLDSNTIKAEYQIIMGIPVFGAIAQGAVPGAYQYTPPVNFFGKDSVEYQICLGSVCKTAFISFVVPKPDCQQLAVNDNYTLPLSDTLWLNVLENDVVCENSILELQTNPSAGVAAVVGKKIRLILPDFFEGSLIFNYVLKNGIETGIGEVSVSLSLTQTYCDQRFKANDDELILPAGFNFRTFKPEDLIFNDIKCIGENPISSFSIVPSPPSNPVFELKFQQNRWWFLIKQPQSFTSGTFKYKVCTNSGKCDTATVVIRNL